VSLTDGGGGALHYALLYRNGGCALPYRNGGVEDFPQLGAPYVDLAAATEEADLVIPYEVLNLMRQYEPQPVPSACLFIWVFRGNGCHVSRGRTLHQKASMGPCVYSDLYALQVMLVSHNLYAAGVTC
jgi:hypothetical protein